MSSALTSPRTGSPRPIPGCGIAAWTATSAAGVGRSALASALAQQRSGLRPNDFGEASLPCWIGRVADVENTPLPTALADWDCRATRLAWLGLQQDGFIDAVAAARHRHGPARIGLVLGTSASTLGATETAFREPDEAARSAALQRSARLNTPHALAAFVQVALELRGPAVTVSTACSSGAKAFAQAERWLRLGWVDAVVAGGVDALCGSVLYGFEALGLVSRERCRPFDAHRHGVSIGEAAAFALLQREPAKVRLRGHGESNDAHHMSAPHPQGLGAELALDDALARAGLDIAEVDYLNLHGTGTARNDETEAALVRRRYATRTHAGATKGLTGHTMGAAGALEAAICLMALDSGLMPGTPHAASSDGVGMPHLRVDTVHAPVRTAVNHSFGFGGNNAVLVFDRA